MRDAISGPNVNPHLRALSRLQAVTSGPVVTPRMPPEADPKGDEVVTGNAKAQSKPLVLTIAGDAYDATGALISGITAKSFWQDGFHQRMGFHDGVRGVFSLVPAMANTAVDMHSAAKGNVRALSLTGDVAQLAGSITMLTARTYAGGFLGSTLFAAGAIARIVGRHNEL